MDYLEQPLARYIEDAAAATPTPGGGSVTALAGALASTMASMAGEFTAGRERFAESQESVADALARLSETRTRLLELAHNDMAAYEAIREAGRLPRGTEEEQAARGDALREATAESLEVVEAVLAACLDVLEVTRELAETANPNLISDVGVAAELALGAARAARVNVRVNLRGYGDGAHADEVRRRTEAALVRAERLTGEARALVETALESP